MTLSDAVAMARRGDYEALRSFLTVEVSTRRVQEIMAEHGCTHDDAINRLIVGAA